MNTLASTVELGAHPATALLLGGLLAAILRGRYAAVVLFLLLFLDCCMFMDWKLGEFLILTFLGMKL